MNLKLDVAIEQWSLELKTKIPLLMEAANVPGLSLAIIRNGQLLCSKGFGSKRAGTTDPVTDGTVFEAASLSKPVFAYAVLKLCEQGRLELDAPLTDYLPDPYIADAPNLASITARRVLNHTCGLPNFRPRHDPLRIESTPGTKFSYSGEGYFYLQHVVEHITGQPLQDYMHAHIFAPFAMRHSSYVWMDSYNADVGFGHDPCGEPANFRREHKTANAAMTMHTRPLDFVQFLLAMMSVDSGDEFRLTEKSLEQMLGSEVQIDNALSWGLGWGLQRTDYGKAFWHWGDVGTYKNFTLALRQQRLGIVIMTNGANGLRICQEIVEMAIGGQHPAFTFPMMNLVGNHIRIGDKSR